MRLPIPFVPAFLAWSLAGALPHASSPSSAEPSARVVPALQEPAAQGESDPKATKPEPAGGGEAELDGLLAKVGARPGPLTADLGGLAVLELPEGLLFADGAGTRTFLEETQNFPSGNEVGLVLSRDPKSAWWAIFRFDDVGRVDDEEKDDLDADELLSSLRASNDAGNEERQRRGWPTVDLVGWQKPPFYDARTNNLTWALHTRSGSGDGDGVNWDVRLLGRRGVMKARLICGVDELPAILPEFERLIGTFEYKQGQKYAEFQKGDRVAEYGLGALVLGGAGLAAAKFGFFTKFWKLILVGLAAAGAFLKNTWHRFFPRKDSTPGGPPPLEG